jgi:putative transposase
MIYRYFMISKQAVYQYEQRQFNRQAYRQDLLEEVKQQRQLHPRMGAKVLYSVIKPPEIGRVRFEELLRENGYNLRRVKSHFRTTDSGWVRYKNLIAGLELNDINQVWVSDITYYLLCSEVCYITTVMDLYSRRILGYSASRTMLSEESSMKSLIMALRARGQSKYPNLIHHSDRGSQYRYKNFTDLLEQTGADISMCRCVYDNSHMERLNGTIKNDYLIPLGVDTFSGLKKLLPIVVKRYNAQRPHSSILGMTPIDFEQHISNIAREKRPKTRVKQEIFSVQGN